MLSKVEIVDVRWSTAEWMLREGEHEGRIGSFIEENMRRRSMGLKHPVYDFLFEYYTFRPGKLRQWVPGGGRWLEGVEAEVFLDVAGFVRREGCVGQPLEGFPESRRSSLRWVIELLSAISGRPRQFRCMGLHEWAMVYEEKDVRHPGLPLRVSEEERRAVVDAMPLCCSHFDAFRFFSKSAQPKNCWPLTQASRMELEQGGCLHANMDLYKWAYKFYPWVASEVLVDAYLLAIDARELDMRASPYDVRGLGLSPVLIETSEGQAEYVKGQMDVAAKAVVVRERLLRELCRLEESVV